MLFIEFFYPLIIRRIKAWLYHGRFFSSKNSMILKVHKINLLQVYQSRGYCFSGVHIH